MISAMREGGRGFSCVAGARNHRFRRALAALFTLGGGIAGFTLGGAIAFGFIAGALADLIGREIVDAIYSGRQHQVHSILAISQRENNEARNALIGAFAEERFAEVEAAEGAQIRMEVEAEFAAAGITPTEEQILEPR
jgi:hypothetical protein